MRCKDIEKLLNPYLDDELEHFLKCKVSEHLDECEACSAKLSRLQTNVNVLKDIPLQDPGPDFNTSVMQVVKAERRVRETFAVRANRWCTAISIILLITVLAIPIYVSGMHEFITGQDIYVLGSETLIPGSRASMRVVVAERGANRPLKNADVTLTLKGPGLRNVELMSGRTNDAGTLNGSFLVPANKTGKYQLTATASSPAGRDILNIPVELKHQMKVLLTTDKPVYQPGQTIRIRTLALLRPSLAPAHNNKIRFIIEDSRKNKVFDKTIKTSKWGIAPMDFQLADEINSGRYTITASAGDTRIKKEVTVKRYALPKYKVSLETDRTYYLPNRTIRGTLSARYFFGKPVSSAKVQVNLSALNTTFAKVTGRTGSDGVFTFQGRVPSSLAKQPVNQGSSFIKIAAAVTDTAGHMEEAAQSVPVANESIRIAFVPESGQLVPGVENIVYVVTSYPDGQPARTNTSLTVNGEKRRAKSDRLGISVFRMTPETGDVTMTVTAATEEGISGSKKLYFDTTPGWLGKNADYYRYSLADGEISTTANLAMVLIRSNQAIYKTGDTAQITILSTKKTGAVYVDAVLDGQTILTQCAYLKDGRARAAIDLSGDYAGTLTFSAYVLSTRGVPVRDTATVLVRNTNDLRVNIRPDRSIYNPGQKAMLQFNVTDKNGRGVPAAIGVNIVDESVFAVEEQMPGLSALYFALQKEIMKPKPQPELPDEYEYHRMSRQDPYTMAREMEKQILSPRPHIAGIMPGWNDPADLLARNNGDALRRAAKVLFASAMNVPDPNTSAITQQLKKEKIEDVQGSFFGSSYETGPGWLVIIAYTSLLVSLMWIAYRNRRPYTLMVTILPVANLAVLMITAVAGAIGSMAGYGHTSYVEIFHSLSIALLIPLTIIAMVAIARLSPAWIQFICGLIGLLLIAAIIMPIFARARECARSSIMASELKLLGRIIENQAPQSAPGSAGASAAPRIRQFFPETLYSNPSLITDENGVGSVELTAADSITTWRVSAMAHSMNGRIGSTNAPLKVFQDFFVDLDLPVEVTQGDAISVPVAVYNYLPTSQSIKIALKESSWYRLNGTSDQTVTLQPNEVSVTYFPIRAAKLGRHSLTVEARSGSAADAVRRNLTVYPNGQRQNGVMNGVASGSTTLKMAIPRYAISGTAKLLVKFYPGVLSQVVNGLDGLLQIPHGCFEQTSSTAYPNVLIAKYLRATKNDKPEVMLKAEKLINLGYQRLLTFEVPGGGFDWYGDAPADTILTAYGVMEFSDMSSVTTVDKSVIKRAKELLEKRQHADGSWNPNERAYKSKLPLTAYVVWALSEAEFDDSDAVKRGCEYLKKNLANIQDPYVIALAANAFVASRYDESTADKLLDRLDEAAVVSKNRALWHSRSVTLVYGSGGVTETETTALAAHAFLKSHTYPTRAQQALNELIATRDNLGSWYTTQATILALKALIAGSTEGVRGTGSVDVLVNGQKAGTVRLNGDDTDIMRSVDVTNLAHPGANNVKLVTRGDSHPAYQVLSEYYVPWARAAKPSKEEMRIDVSYGKLRIAREGTVDVTARVKAANEPVKMAIVDLGVSPGFGVVTDDLDTLKSRHVIDNYEVTPRQIILYLRNIRPGNPVTLCYKLRALYPVKAQVPASRAYDYYNPNTRKSQTMPMSIEVL